VLPLPRHQPVTSSPACCRMARTDSRPLRSGRRPPSRQPSAKAQPSSTRPHLPNVLAPHPSESSRTSSPHGLPKPPAPPARRSIPSSTVLSKTAARLFWWFGSLWDTGVRSVLTLALVTSAGHSPDTVQNLAQAPCLSRHRCLHSGCLPQRLLPLPTSNLAFQKSGAGRVIKKVV